MLKILDDVAHRVISDIHHFFSRERVENAATQGERVRLARELHDGLLQSLTGIALQLETIARLLDGSPVAARSRLRDVQELVAVEQQTLRVWVASLLQPVSGAITTGDELSLALEELCRQAESHWQFRCRLTFWAHGSLPPVLGDHIYRIVREGLNNAGRHARAKSVQVEIHMGLDRLDIVMSDDGVGFPFHGQYDMAELMAGDLGPRSLLKRISLLKGGLVLTSSPSGSQLRIKVPLPDQAWPGPGRSAGSS